MEKINYNSKKKKIVNIKDCKRYTLAILLASSLATTYTVVDVLKDGVNAVSDIYHYNKESNPYYEMVSKEFYRVPTSGNLALDVYDVVRNFKEISYDDKDDVYHGLIECARFFRFNLDKNFKQFLNCLDLNELSRIDSKYPSEAELYEFLNNNEFLNEDGSIDFDAWRDYDKRVFNMERRLNNFKENVK